LLNMPDAPPVNVYTHKHKNKYYEGLARLLLFYYKS
jgi:hypothetical protein